MVKLENLHACKIATDSAYPGEVNLYKDDETAEPFVRIDMGQFMANPCDTGGEWNAESLAAMVRAAPKMMNALKQLLVEIDYADGGRFKAWKGLQAARMHADAVLLLAENSGEV